MSPRPLLVPLENIVQKVSLIFSITIIVVDVAKLQNQDITSHLYFVPKRKEKGTDWIFRKLEIWLDSSRIIFVKYLSQAWHDVSWHSFQDATKFYFVFVFSCSWTFYFIWYTLKHTLAENSYSSGDQLSSWYHSCNRGWSQYKCGLCALWSRLLLSWRVFSNFGEMFTRLLLPNSFS